MSRRTVALAGSLALCLASTAMLSAQTPAQYQTQLQGYMNNYAGQALNSGYSVLQPMVTGNLAQSANTSHNVTLNAGTRYMIIGVCDNDCTDLDLSLFGPDGSTVASDFALDDHPMLRFSAPTSGSFRLQVNMATCRQAPCYYGVQLFGAAGGAVPQPTPLAAPTSMGAPNAMGMIGANQQVAGNLTTMDARYNGKAIQAWGFNCNAGQSFQMDILSTWDNYAIVFDPFGNQVAQDDDTGEGLNARINYTCPQAGMYRLGVTTYTASTTPGPYTLQVQSATGMAPQPTPMPTPMNAPTPMATPQSMTAAVPAPGAIGSIATGQTMNGRLETGDQQMTDGTWADVWQFQGQAGQTITIELRSAEFDTYLQLLDNAGSRLAEDDDSLGDLDSRIVFRLATAGTYQIVVNNFTDNRRAGTYQLSVR